MEAYRIAHFYGLEDSFFIFFSVASQNVNTIYVTFRCEMLSVDVDIGKGTVKGTYILTRMMMNYECLLFILGKELFDE